MIRLRPQRRIHVSNRFALLGAVLVALACYPGYQGGNSQPASLAERDTTTSSQQARNEADSTTAGKRITISQLLFGHG